MAAARASLWPFLLRVGRYPARDGDSLSEPLLSLMYHAVQRIAAISIPAAYLWLLWTCVRSHPHADFAGLLPPVLLALTRAICLKLGRHPWLGRGILLLGLFFCAALSLRFSAGAGRPLALATTLVFGFLSGPWASLAVAAALVFLGWALLPAGPLDLGLLREAGIGLAVAWATAGSFYHAIELAEGSEKRAWQHAREAMQRRAQLQAKEKMLRDMYALLERTNHELELARREAEQLKEIKARFAAQISHELRTPLNLILGFSRMMYRCPEAYGDVRWTPELRLDVYEIYRASRHLSELIDDILDLARIEANRLPLKLEMTDLAELVRDAAATARNLLRTSAVTLEVNVQENLPPVLADRTRVRQVLLNLLNNAVRFTDSGSITVSLRAEAGEVRLSVVDTGVGIPPEELESIFDEFAQAKGSDDRGGTGLGLALCKQIVQLHGGRIWAESAPGRGSAFHFTIPIPKTGAARSRLRYYRPAGWQPPLPPNPLGKVAVILAPDEAAGRAVARHLEGYRAIILTRLDSLPEVVESEHPAGIILVSDPLSPQARIAAPEDIWQLVGRPDLGVIECSVPMESLACRFLGVQAYLTKPVEPEQLLACIRRTCTPPRRILILDDEAAFRSLMERVLSSEYPQATVEACSNGAEGLTCLTQQRFDLVLLDLAMPGGSGVEFLQRAKESGLLREAKVIVLTGAPYVEELARHFPARLQFSRQAQPDARWLTCLRALLDSAPADYTRPRLHPVPPRDPQPAPAS
mgnify:CR=1 FL=1